MKINTPVEPAKTEPAAPPETARESIRAAMDEIKEKVAEEQKVEAPNEEKTEPKVVETKKEEIKKPVEVKSQEIKEVKEPKSEETEVVTEAKTTEEKKEEPAKESKSTKPAPFGASKRLRASWDLIPDDAKDEVSKILKESLDTKANAGRKSYLNEVDQVLTPYMPELQRLGATPAQLVDRLLKYSNALANEQYKYHAIAKLAQDFNIDLTAFSRPAIGDQNDTPSQEDNIRIDPATAELSSKLDMIMQEFSQLKGNQRSDNDKAAERTVNEWSGFDPATNSYSKRPYFPYVRQAMSQLIVANAVPLKDGKIDLDAVYEAACYAHPEIREHMLEEQNRALEAKKLEEQKQQAAAITRAKNAGSSIKPAAPAPRLPSQVNPKTNANGKQFSVRESLRAAIAEARDARI